MSKAMPILGAVTFSFVFLLTKANDTGAVKQTTAFQGHIWDLGWNDSEVAASAGRLVVVLQAFDRDIVESIDNGGDDAEQQSGRGIDAGI